MVKLSVGLADCIFNSLCILTQGFTASEVDRVHWGREAESADWPSIVGFEDDFRDTQRSRVLELAMVYLSPIDSTKQESSSSNATGHDLSFVPEHSLNTETEPPQLANERSPADESSQTYHRTH